MKTFPHPSQRAINVVAGAVLTATSGCVRFDVSPKDNHSPKVVVAESLTVAVGERVQLDASGSSDPDGDELSYQWEQLSPGEPVQLEGSTEAVASFFAPSVGQRLFFRLTVSDGAAAAEPVTVRVRVNSPPVAQGPEEVRILGQASVAIEGGGVDPDGDAIASYTWRVASAPAGAAACSDEPSPCLSGADAATVTFTPPVKGDYALELVVSDGDLDSVPLLIPVHGPNFAPTLTVAADVIDAAPGSTVLLVGNGSDPDGDALAYAWSQQKGIGQPVVLQNADKAQASFVAPSLGQSLFFEVVASDGELESPPAVVEVRVNTPPVANAGPPVDIIDAASAVLAGAGSDADGDNIVGYAWRVTAAPAAAASCVTVPPAVSPCLQGASLPTVTFTPPVKGDYQLELTVFDGKVWSAPSLVAVSGPNSSPSVSVANNVIDAAPGSTVVLAGSGNDSDGDSLTFLWSQVEGAGLTVSLQNADSDQATFTAPSIAQTLLFRLVASDGHLFSSPAVVQVRVNGVPIANAGPTQVLNGTDTAVVVGAGADPDGDPIVAYEWRVVSAPTSGASCVSTPSPCLLGDTSAIVTFTAPSFSARGDYVLELRVSDGKVYSLPSQVTLRGPNTPPVASAPTSLLVATSDTVTLTGSGSDADGDPLTYAWEQTSGDPVQLLGADTETASFGAPDVGQRMYFKLTVSDGFTVSEPAITYVRVNAPPVADAGDAQDVVPGEAILLQGSGTDPDGDAIVDYTWSVASGPAGSSCLSTPPDLSPCFSGPGAGGAIVFTAPSKGDYVLDLVVSDGALTSLSASVLVRAVNRAPTALASFSPAGPFLAGDTVTLDAAGSTDIDGDGIASWRWTVLDKPLGAAVVFSPITADAQQTQVTLGQRGSYLFGLTITDDDATSPASGSDSIRVEVSNTPPAVDAGTGAAVPNGTEAVLLGTATDVDLDALTYSWVLLEAPDNQTVSLLGADGPTVRFTPTHKTSVTDPAQCLAGQCYKLALSVNDGHDTSTDYVYVTSLDRKPVADAGADFSVVDSSLVELDALASYDPDGDAITLYRWTQLLGLDVTGGVGYLDGSQVSFSVPGNGTYVFSLSVRAAGVWSDPDEVSVFVNNGDQRPTLTSSGTDFTAVEGSGFTGFGINANDAEPGTLTITWTKLDGAPQFPAQLLQSQTVGGAAPADPVIHIASFAALFDGKANATEARYSVVATDGANNASDPIIITLYVLPNPASYYFLAPSGDDANACTDVDPCYTLRRVANLASTAPRDVIMLAGSYSIDFDSATLRVDWPSNTRLFARREAGSYVRSATPTHVIFNRINCWNDVGAIHMVGATGAAFYDLEMDVAGKSSCSIPAIDGVYCDSCRADFYGVDINAVEPILVSNGGRPTHRGIFAINVGSEIHFARGSLHVVNASATNRAVDAENGAVVHVEEAELLTVAAAITGDNSGVYVDTGASVRVSRSQLLLYGDDPGSPDFSSGRFSAAVASQNGSFSMENSVVHVTAGPEAVGVYVAGGTLSLVNDTLVAPTSVAGASAGVFTDVAVNVMNTLVSGFLTPLVLSSSAALESQLFSNAWVAPGATLASCDGTAVSDIAALNSAPGTGACNTSAVTWSGNSVGPCALVNPAARDFHLIFGAGACIDAGALSSPAGVAPSDDMDATFANEGNTLLNSIRPSPRSPAIDIGADEAD